MRTLTASLTILLLTACGSQATPSRRQVDRAIAHANAQANAAAAIEKAEPAASPTRPPPIPPAFQDRWGLIVADCDPTRDDAKGLMTITSDALRFYESRAQLSKIIGSWPEKLEAEFAFTGEGQSWTKTETLALVGSSKTLIRTEDGKDLRYTRCPAE